jgi:trans-L-3-hydroxyproline dehydratase
VDGLPEIKGKTILEKRKYFRDNFDALRTGLMFEPRGHADMYGAVITEPVTSDGDFGVFFMHNEGYSTMCGHAIIALTKLVIETGMIRKEGSDPVLLIDAPPGRVVASAKKEGNQVTRVSFLNVPSFLLLREEVTEVPGIGKIKLDVAFGGAFYAFYDVGPLGLKLDSKNYNRLIDLGKKIKQHVSQAFEIKHPYEEELGFLYGTIFTGPPEKPENYSRNVCIFAEGEVDRSPTGSGVSARAAIHHAKGEMMIGKRYTIESILGTTMEVRIIKTTKYGEYDAVIPEVSGTAHFTGMHEFIFDPDDPLRKGFIFR